MICMIRAGIVYTCIIYYIHFKNCCFVASCFSYYFLRKMLLTTACGLPGTYVLIIPTETHVLLVFLLMPYIYRRRINSPSPSLDVFVTQIQGCLAGSSPHCPLRRCAAFIYIARIIPRFLPSPRLSPIPAYYPGYIALSAVSCGVFGNKIIMP